MAKLPRANQKIFGVTAGLDQIEKFGSLATGTPEFTTDPEEIQELSNYEEGWFAGVVGNNVPAIEDMNALFYLYSYQLAYIFQAGIPEWNEDTTYFVGSIVNVEGVLYVSIQNTNLNHAVSDAAWWINKTQPSSSVFTESGTFVAPAGVTRVKVISEYNSPLIKVEDTQYQFAQTLCFSIPDVDGNLISWGYNPQGQLGVGNNSNQATPQRVLMLPNVQARNVLIEGDGASECNGMAIDHVGQLWMWGNNFHGQMGDDSVSSTSSPVLVASSKRFRKWANGNGVDGSNHAIDLDGNAYGWGQNLSGCLGVNDVTARSTPTLVVGGHIWDTLNKGVNNSVLAIDENGVGYGWGENGNGELGLGDVTDRSTPTVIVGSHVWRQLVPIQPSGNAGLGLDTAGKAWGWGENSKGNIGAGNNTNTSSPVAVAGSIVFSTLVKGETLSSSLPTYGGIDVSGNCWMWGNNTVGQLGNNDNSGTPRSSPVLVVGGHVFTQLFCLNGGGTFFALDNTGQLWGWGRNNSAIGILGNNTVTDAYSSPVLVAGGKKFISLMTQTQTSMGIEKNGQVWCWGENSQGQCGTGESVVNHSSPVIILGVHPTLIQPAPTEWEFTVVPGQSYDVVIGGACMFEDTVVSQMANQITVEYAN